ncbi:MAG: hypothetical protein ACREJ0_12930 [Geminicoccaceae bacterium]
MDLIEAADGAIGSSTDRLFLLCYEYDPETGKYTVTVLAALRIAGVATVLGLGGFTALALLRECRGARGGG